MNDRIEFSYGKDKDYNNLTKITFFNKFEIILTDVEKNMLFAKLVVDLDKEVRDKW